MKSCKQYSIKNLHVTFARGDNVLLFVKVVLVALDMAAATLQGGWRLKNVPQWLGAGVAVGREMIQCGDEFMALVGKAVGLVPLRNCLHVHLLPALSLIGIKNLNMDRVTLKMLRLKYTAISTNPTLYCRVLLFLLFTKHKIYAVNMLLLLISYGVIL